jgi:hypothetical protein
MPLPKLTKYFIIACICMAGRLVAAQPFSYVYIQGDKITPFYVKMDGQMMPRYGKNYCILSELAPGPIHIEILFQQKVFPSQEFTINVPENGSRGFLLSRQGDGFGLYDIRQKKYITTNDQ